MGNVMPKVRFNLLKKAGADEAHIYLIFNYWQDGKVRAQFKKIVPDAKIPPQFFDLKKQRIKYDAANPTRHNKINERMEQMALHTVAIFKDNNSGCISPKDMDAELVYRMGWRARPVPKDDADPIPSLFDFIHIYIEERDGGKRGTEKVLKTWAGLFQTFVAEYYRRPISYKEVDNAFFAAFQKWCYAPPRLHSPNYFSKGVSVIRQFMREAARRGFHENTAYTYFNVKRLQTTQIALSFAELEALYKLELTERPGLERARDLFLVQAHTGVRFSDLHKVGGHSIEQMANGQNIINVVTQKTGTAVAIPLLPIAAEILAKYQNQLPPLSPSKMNRHLKELGQLAGLDGQMLVITGKGGKRNDEYKARWELLSTHVARRSFATNYYRDGVPAHVLMQITGHATEKQFMQYIKIDGKESAAKFAELQSRKTPPLKLKKTAG